MNGILKYYIGNSRDLLKIVKRRNIPPPNLIISSPPYFDLLDYDGKNNQIGHGQIDYDAYLTDVANVFQQCYKLSQINASFWLIIDTFRKEGEIQLLPFDIYKKLKDLFKKDTWILKDIIIWDKEKNIPWNSKGRFKNQFEYILFFTKENNFTFNIDEVREINDLKKWWLTYPERYNPDGKAPSNVWNYITPIRGWGNGKQNHFCSIPFPLAEKIIRIATNKDDNILDPFAGSGSALALASYMGRNAYGIDINLKYKKKFTKEVIIGAKNFWNKNEKQIELNKKAIIDFKNTNIKLRKLKLASNIANYINSLNKTNLVYLLINKQGFNVELIVFYKKNKPSLILEDEKLTKLIKQSKINLSIKAANIAGFKKNRYKKINCYDITKFYKWIKVIDYQAIFNSNTKYSYLHSNLILKLKY